MLHSAQGGSLSCHPVAALFLAGLPSTTPPARTMFRPRRNCPRGHVFGRLWGVVQLVHNTKLGQLAVDGPARPVDALVHDVCPPAAADRTSRSIGVSSSCGCRLDYDRSRSTARLGSSGGMRQANPVHLSRSVRAVRDLPSVDRRRCGGCRCRPRAPGRAGVGSSDDRSSTVTPA